MRRLPLKIVRASLIGGLLISRCAYASEPLVVSSPLQVSFVDRATATVQDAIDQAIDLLGVRYRYGGSSPEAGFDCSGFVSHVFHEGLGVILPRTSKELSKSGEAISRDDLRPGDLVFFNTMRNAFSHVGIYLGDDQFVHAPRRGGRVRIEDLRGSYWRKHFDGARRITLD
jgi:cell wall-associated NlpC family hydrolase